MTRATWACAAAAGALLTAGVGCYSPAPYSPGYGYPSYQTAPPAGAYPMAPGGTYPGGAIPGGGSYVVPGGGVPGTLGPATTTPSIGPTLAPPINGSDPPPATYAPGSTPPGGTVPNYEDPNAGDFDSGSGFGAPPDDGFQPPATNGDTPFYQGTTAPRPLGSQQAGTKPLRNDYLAGLDEFQVNARPTVPSNLGGTASQVRPAGFEENRTTDADFGFDPSATPDQPVEIGAAEGDGGFGHDRTGYAWLRGVVDYDPTRKNWHIIYGLPPDPNDRFGGSLTLADGGRLREFRDNDVVLVQGRIDPTAGQDTLGKPLYRVTAAELIGRFE